ncbi:STAS domain-containing protein [Mycobacterium sp.]|uniref:STAS domain-containing protein n=1 Tax=Mycobacterium sp. TaxID=1785 RepID=UPI003447D173
MPGNRDEERRRAGHASQSPPSIIIQSARSGLTVTAVTVAHSRVLNFYGVLDATTYHRVRDAILKAAADRCRAVIIDVTRLSVADSAPWSQFTTACEQIAEWPDVRIALVCDSIAGQKILRRTGISGQIPVYWSVAAAVAAQPSDNEHSRRQRHAESHPESRWLAGWPTTPLETQAARFSYVSPS